MLAQFLGFDSVQAPRHRGMTKIVLLAKSRADLSHDDVRAGLVRAWLLIIKTTATEAAARQDFEPDPIRFFVWSCRFAAKVD